MRDLGPHSVNLNWFRFPVHQYFNQPSCINVFCKKTAGHLTQTNTRNSTENHRLTIANLVSHRRCKTYCLALLSYPPRQWLTTSMAHDAMMASKIL